MIALSQRRKWDNNEGMEAEGETATSGRGAFTLEQLRSAASAADFRASAAFLLEDVGLPTFPTEHYPKWVRRCAEKVNRALFPKVYDVLEKKKGSQAYSVGVAFGLMTGGQSGLREHLAKLTVEIPEPTDEQAAAIWRWFYREDADRLTRPTDGGLVADEYRKEFQEIESGMGSTDLAELHQGVADAARMIGGDNKATETTNVYKIMLTFWRVVDGLPDINALFDMLTKALDANAVGSDPKRISQLCGRIGKSFRPPGRPRKTTSTQLSG
jgi:hypothetical protein